MAKRQTKQTPATPATPAPVAPVAAPVALHIAPQVAPTGSTRKGAHHNAFVRCAPWPTDATVKLVPGSTMPWADHCNGAKFYRAVLAKGAATVEACIVGGKAIGLTPADVQGHLRYLYTWGNYIEIGGKVFATDAHAKAPR